MGWGRGLRQREAWAAGFLTIWEATQRGREERQARQRVWAGSEIAIGSCLFLSSDRPVGRPEGCRAPFQVALGSMPLLFRWFLCARHWVGRAEARISSGNVAELVEDLLIMHAWGSIPQHLMNWAE